ncbi:MAG: ParB N-terminal domain-containing protein [Sulfolobaceae archaeon]
MALVEPHKLLPHEDVNEDNLEKILNIIKISNSFKPIIVDYNSNVIIDGHHRWFASRLLKLKRIPVIYIDYTDSRIKVGNWFIKVKNKLLFKKIINNYYSYIGNICINFDDFKICEESYYKFYWKLYIILQKFNIIEKSDREGYKLPEVEREYIIEIAKRRVVFPAKTTRHSYGFIIPEFTFPLNELL